MEPTVIEKLQQPALAQTHLEELRQKFTGLRSIAMAVRIVAELLRDVEGRLTLAPCPCEITQIMRLKLKELGWIKEEALQMDQIITAMLQQVSHSPDPTDQYRMLDGN